MAVLLLLPLEYDTHSIYVSQHHHLKEENHVKNFMMVANVFEPYDGVDRR